jgi:hypothetical protein
LGVQEKSKKEITIGDLINAGLADFRWARRLAVFGSAWAISGGLVASALSVLIAIIEDN